MPSVEEILSHKELIDYTKTRTPQKKVLEELFPARKTEALEIKMIKGANNLPVSASVHAFDTNFMRLWYPFSFLASTTK